jgi:hypothetical protein
MVPLHMLHITVWKTEYILTPLQAKRMVIRQNIFVLQCQRQKTQTMLLLQSISQLLNKGADV